MKITLKKPIQFGTEKITELEFRDEVKAKDLLGVKISEIDLADNVLKVAGRLCGQPAPVMQELDAQDLMAVTGFVAGFFGGGPETGSAGLQ